MRIFAPKRLTALFVFVCSFNAIASTSGLEVAKLFGAETRAEYGLKIGLENLRKSDPDAAADLAKAFSQFNGNEIAKRIGLVYEQSLSEKDFEVVRTFADTPVGKKYLEAFRNHLDPSALRATLNQLQGADRSETLKFQNSETFSKLIAVMQSDNVRRISAEYREELTCAHYKKNNKKAFSNANAQGRCL
jgi:hypothetical protein